jgi:hypothetical protein
MNEEQQEVDLLILETQKPGWLARLFYLSVIPL